MYRSNSDQNVVGAPDSSRCEGHGLHGNEYQGYGERREGDGSS